MWDAFAAGRTMQETPVQAIHWETDLDVAMARAERAQRPLFLHFTANANRRMENEVLAQPNIAARLNENFVMVWIDAAENPALAQQYSVTAVPTDLIMRLDGQIIHRRVGVVSADRFAEYLEFLQDRIQADSDRTPVAELPETTPIESNEPQTSESEGTEPEATVESATNEDFNSVPSVDSPCPPCLDSTTKDTEDTQRTQEEVDVDVVAPAPTAEEIDSHEFLKDLSYKTVQQNHHIAAAWLTLEDHFSVLSRRGTGGTITTGEFPNPDAAPPVIRAAQAKRTVITVPERQNGSFVVTISTPIQNGNGRLRGVSGIDVNTEALSAALREAMRDNPLFRRANGNGGGKAYLIAPNGRIVATTDSNTVIGSTSVRVDNRTEASFEEELTLAGEKWKIQLVVPRAVAEIPQAIKNGFAAQQEAVQANGKKIAGEMETLYSQLQAAEKTRQETATGWHRTFAGITLALIFLIAYIWQRSLTQRSQWHGNVQQQVLDSLISPVFLVDVDSSGNSREDSRRIDSRESVKNKAATRKTSSVIDAYIQSLGQQKQNIIREQVG